MPDFDQHQSGLWVPETSTTAEQVGGPPAVIVDNRTGLPDGELLDYFEMNASAFGWTRGAEFHMYRPQGSMFARSQAWTPPATPIEEIQVARDLAERDDDVAPTIEMLIAAATADGFQNQHEDEHVQTIFDRMTEAGGFMRSFKEMYREWLIAGSVTTATVLTAGNFDIRPRDVSRVLTRTVGVPNIGVLPAENIRVIGNDLIGQGQLAYAPSGRLAEWLREFFGRSTTPARRAEMRRQDPVSAALFIDTISSSALSDASTSYVNTIAAELYLLNPAMVHRSTMPKGAWQYPRPPMTRNLPLLEAKRLLNIMDFALLQGGTNYIIVAKKGSDQRPAMPAEISNLREVIRRASHTGVIIGDHRLSVEVVTPDLRELLNPEKRSMLGKKLALAMLRTPDVQGADDANSSDFFSATVERVVAADRNALRDHVHRFVWPRVMQRNAGVFGRIDRPDLWFPRVMLVGADWFTDYLLKMYDRGDLPRKYLVEYGGFDYDATRAQKEREQAHGDDEIFQPPAVPFSSPDQGPQDNGGGRPRGSGPDNGAPGARRRSRDPAARPRRLIRRTRGENVRADWLDEENAVARIGVLTEALLDEFPDAALGRMTRFELRASSVLETTQEGPVVMVPVNVEDELGNLRVVRLEEGFSVVLGYRTRDGALMTRALCFREPNWTLAAAEDTAMRFGFEIEIAQDEPEPTPA